MKLQKNAGKLHTAIKNSLKKTVCKIVHVMDIWELSRDHFNLNLNFIIFNFILVAAALFIVKIYKIEKKIV